MSRSALLALVMKFKCGGVGNEIEECMIRITRAECHITPPPVHYTSECQDLYCEKGGFAGPSQIINEHRECDIIVMAQGSFQVC